MDYGDLLRSEDYDGLAEMVRQKMMIPVEGWQLRHTVRMYMFLYTKEDDLRYKGSNANAYTWLKNRLQDAGVLN